MEKIERREVQVGQYMMYYQVTGEGEPLVLVHGLSGSLRWWSRNVPALAEHYRVYLIDLPGFGMMRHFPRRLMLDEVADELVAWMKAVGIVKAHLIAHSMGGYICLRVAASRPEVVDRLVLVSPAGIPKFRSVLGYTIPLIVAIRYLTPRFFPVLAYDALRAGPLTLLRAAQDLLTKDIRDYLKSIKAPTLLIWGVNDTLVPPVLGDVLRQEITHAHLLLLKRAGHVGMFDQPEEFNAAVLAFLRGEEIGRPSTVTQLSLSLLFFDFICFLTKGPIHFKDESISLCRPFASREAQALSASEGSLCGKRSFARAQDDTREAASFDWQNVFFEMYWAKGWHRYMIGSRWRWNHWPDSSMTFLSESRVSKS